MSAQNRTALKALITAWAASLDLEATHKPTEQHILDSVLLNRDDVNTIAATTAATNVVFTGYDTIIVNANTSSVLTISGVSDGEVKYLIINKSAGNAITFAGATANGYNQTYENTLTLLVYKIISKGSAGNLAIAMHKTFDYTAILTSTSIAPEDWQEATLLSPWTSGGGGLRAGVWYRINVNMLDISIDVSRTLTWLPEICTLPVGYRPIYASNFPISYSTTRGYITINTSGNVYCTATPAGSDVGTIVLACGSIPLT